LLPESYEDSYDSIEWSRRNSNFLSAPDGRDHVESHPCIPAKSDIFYLTGIDLEIVPTAAHHVNDSWCLEDRPTLTRVKPAKEVAREKRADTDLFSIRPLSKFAMRGGEVLIGVGKQVVFATFSLLLPDR
jgi:hypothetical protein